MLQPVHSKHKSLYTKTHETYWLLRCMHIHGFIGDGMSCQITDVATPVKLAPCPHSLLTLEHLLVRCVKDLIPRKKRKRNTLTDEQKDQQRSNTQMSRVRRCHLLTISVCILAFNYRRSVLLLLLFGTIREQYPCCANPR